MDYDGYIADAKNRIFAVLRSSVLKPDFETDSIIYKTVGDGSRAYGKPAPDVYADLGIAELRKRAVASPAIMALAFLKRTFAYLCLIAAGVYTTVFCPLIFFVPRRLRSRPPKATTTKEATKPRVSIVMLSYKRIKTLEMSIRCLVRSTQGDNQEIIVVDNGSGPEATARLEALKAEGLFDKLILNRGNMGISEGYNMGFSAADPESRFLVKLDQDIQILSSGWLDAAMAIFAASPKVGLVALDQSNHPGMLIAPRFRLAGTPIRVKSWLSWICGSCMMIPREVFAKLGYFRENTGLKYFPDDVDYFNRAVRAGYETYYLCGKACYHVPKATQYAILGLFRVDPEVRKWHEVLLQLLDRYDAHLDPILQRYDRYPSPSAD